MLSLVVTKKGIRSMASTAPASAPVITDVATLEEVIAVLQEHLHIEMEGDSVVHNFKKFSS